MEEVTDHQRCDERSGNGTDGDSLELDPAEEVTGAERQKYGELGMTLE